MGPHGFVYLDDIIVAEKTITKHFNHLRTVFKWFRKENLNINSEKCEFGKKDARYLSIK